MKYCPRRELNNLCVYMREPAVQWVFFYVYQYAVCIMYMLYIYIHMIYICYFTKRPSEILSKSGIELGGPKWRKDTQCTSEKK